MRIFYNKKAQAMVEMAILGPLLLVAVGLVATYVAKLNNDHWMLMSAFRNALAKAHDTNMLTSYGTWDDRRMVSATQPIIGQKTTSSGSAAVHWSVNNVSGSGQSPTDMTYVKINGGSIPYFNEYPLGSGKAGAIEPSYLTSRNAKLMITMKGEDQTSTHSGGVGEFMFYKIENKIIPQGRGHGASRTFSVRGAKNNE